MIPPSALVYAPTTPANITDGLAERLADDAHEQAWGELWTS